MTSELERKEDDNRSKQARLHLYKAAMMLENEEPNFRRVYWRVRNALAALNGDSYTVEPDQSDGQFYDT